LNESAAARVVVHEVRFHSGRGGRHRPARHGRRYGGRSAHHGGPSRRGAASASTPSANRGGENGGGARGGSATYGGGGTCRHGCGAGRTEAGSRCYSTHGGLR